MCRDLMKIYYWAQVVEALRLEAQMDFLMRFAAKPAAVTVSASEAHSPLPEPTLQDKDDNKYIIHDYTYSLIGCPFVNACYMKKKRCDNEIFTFFVKQKMIYSYTTMRK